MLIVDETSQMTKLGEGMLLNISFGVVVPRVQGELAVSYR